MKLLDVKKAKISQQQEVEFLLANKISSLSLLTGRTNEDISCWQNLPDTTPHQEPSEHDLEVDFEDLPDLPDLPDFGDDSDVDELIDIYPCYKTIEQPNLAYGSMELDEILSKLNMNIATAQQLSQPKNYCVCLEGLTRFEPHLIFGKTKFLRASHFDFSKKNKFFVFNLENYGDYNCRIEKLNLGKLNLTKLPNNFGQKFKRLRELNIENNSLHSIPDSLYINTDINVIIANNNQISEISTKIHEATDLRYLLLSGNKLTSLPLEINQSNGITRIDVSNNQLTHLFDYQANDDEQEYKRLSSQIWGSYKDINDCKRKGCYFVDYFEDDIEVNHWLGMNINYLDLSNNQLKFLPKDICYFDGLKYLNLSGNPWMYLPNDDNFRQILINTGNRDYLPLTFKTKCCN